MHQPFSRRAFAPELCRLPKRTNINPGVIFVRRRRWWDRPPSRSCAAKPRHCEERSDEAIQDRRHRVWIASSQTLLAMTKRKAERRKALFNNHRILRCGTRPFGRARLSAFHHGTCGSDRTPPLSSSHATSWDSFGARAPMVRKTRASQHTTRNRQPAPMRHSRALPAPCCPSPARLHPQSGHDAVRACLAQAARVRR